MNTPEIPNPTEREAEIVESYETKDRQSHLQTQAPEGGALKTMGLALPSAIAFGAGDFAESAIDWLSFGLFFFFSLIASVGISYFVYQIQKEQFQDNKGLAAGKAALVFTFLLLPTPIFGLLAVPAGIAGAMYNKRK